MKKIFWIVVIFLAICLGTVIYAYETGVFAATNGSLTAGLIDWFGTIWGGFDCAAKIARCTSDAAYCQRMVKEEANRCKDYYNKRVTRCNKYQERAETYFQRCYQQEAQCRIRAERYKTWAERYEGVKKEKYLQRYMDYVSGCITKYNSCEIKAQQKKAAYLQRQADCIQKAKEYKKKCDNKYLERQARRIEQCLNRGKRCLERLIDGCGPLVPSI